MCGLVRIETRTNRGRKKNKIIPLKWFGNLKGRLKSAPRGCIEGYEFKKPGE